MFATMRKFVLPGVILAVFFFMLLIVLEWGADFSGKSQYGGRPNVAGIVNGEEISLQYYNQIFSQMYQAEAQASDQDLSEARVKQLENSAWQQLLQDRLLTQEANRYNITVSDKDVFAYLRISPPQFIQQSPSFQTDGQFDYQKYLNTMTDPQAAPFWAQIEPAIRSDVQKLKLQQLVTQMAHVTEDEAKQSFIDSVETISVKMVNIPFSRFASSPPLTNDEEQRKFYEGRKDDYLLDERAVLNYVSVEIKATDMDWTNTETESRRLHDLLLAGSDFAELAGLYSDDGSASSGGDLGWFEQGRMVPAFDSLSFSMKEGDISEPFKTEFGWHIIKHQGYRVDSEIPSGKTAKEDVRKSHVSHILIKVRASSESRDALNLKLDGFVTKANKDGFMAAAEASGLETTTTVAFQQGTFIRELRGFFDAVDFASRSKVNEISLVYKHSDKYYVLQLAKIIPAGLATYEEVQSRVRQDYVRFHIEQNCFDTLAAILTAVQSGSKLDAAAKKFGASVETISEMTRGMIGARLRRDPKAIGAAFSLTNPNDLSAATMYSGGSVLFSLISREQPDLTSYNEKRDSVLQFVTQVKQQELFQTWYQNLLENSDIQNFVTDL